MLLAHLRGHGWPLGVIPPILAALGARATQAHVTHLTLPLALSRPRPDLGFYVCPALLKVTGAHLLNRTQADGGAVDGPALPLIRSREDVSVGDKDSVVRLVGKRIAPRRDCRGSNHQLRIVNAEPLVVG